LTRGFNSVADISITQGSALGNSFQAFLANGEFQQVQVDLAREKVKDAAQLASGFGLHSQLAVAEVTDIYNQMGKGGATRALEQAMSNHPGSEQQAVGYLCAITDQRRANGSSRSATIASSFSADRRADINAPTTS
jgi:hypothetical protein